MKYLEIKRIPKVGEVNLNNVIYDVDSYRKCLDEFKKHNNGNYGQLNIFYEIYPLRWDYITSQSYCGTVTEVDDEKCICEVDDTNELGSKVIELYNNPDYDVKIYMRSMVDGIPHTDIEKLRKATLCKILGFDMNN